MQIKTIFGSVVSYITDAPALDPITVITRDAGPNQGQIIIECYGKAWATTNVSDRAFQKAETVRQFLHHQ